MAKVLKILHIPPKTIKIKCLIVRRPELYDLPGLSYEWHLGEIKGVGIWEV